MKIKLDINNTRAKIKLDILKRKFKMIKRELYQALKNHLLEKEITLITGPRQAGKTTLMQMLKSELDKKRENVIYFNLDLEKDQQIFSSQEKLIQKIKFNFGEKKCFIFVDEIQNKENAGVFLKGVFDTEPNFKFIVSGSGSLELKEKIHESLAGRKRVFQLATVSYSEFVNYKTNYAHELKLAAFGEIENEKMTNLLNEYLIFGGYPKVVTENDFLKKRETIDEIYQSYLIKDISYLLKIKKTQSFTHLVTLLSGQEGNLVNHNELSATLETSLQTIKDYLWYLEQTYIIDKVTPFFRNVRKEITKAPKYYFSDLGMKNHALGRFGVEQTNQDLELLFENLFFLILKNRIQHTNAHLHFWRTKDKAEVDFILELGTKLTPYEIKYQNLKEVKISRSFRNFLEKYQPEEAFLINLGLRKTIKLNRTKIHFIPYYDLL